MPEVMSTADAQLLCLRDLPLFRGTVPSKFQSILATGQPIIVSAPGDVSRLTKAADAGIAVAPEDPAALADAMIRMAEQPADRLDQMGRNGRAFYERELSEERGAGRLLELLERAAKDGSA
jgi:glycosyltransferase involved in cell wall biosynthesis